MKQILSWRFGGLARFKANWMELSRTILSIEKDATQLWDTGYEWTWQQCKKKNDPEIIKGHCN